MNGHAGSDTSFLSIEDNAAQIISYIDEHFDGHIHTPGGLSLGGQIALEILTQRPHICTFALIESASVKPSKLTKALIRPTFLMSYGLIKQRWFAKLQAAYLGIPKELFDSYFQDTCSISKEDMIAFLQNSSTYSLKPSLSDTAANVLICVGSKEQPAIRSSGKLLATQLQHSTLEILPGYAHGDLSLNHPGQLAAKINDLVTKVKRNGLQYE